MRHIALFCSAHNIFISTNDSKNQCGYYVAFECRHLFKTVKRCSLLIERLRFFQKELGIYDEDRLYRNSDGHAVHLRAPGNGVSSGSSRVAGVSAGAIVICITCHQRKRQ